MKNKYLFITLALGMILTMALLGVLGAQNAPVQAAPHAAESGADWDGLSVSGPTVISDTGTYRMWYEGRGLTFYGWGATLGYAESTDGVTWAEYPGNPVLEPGEPGEWDSAYRGQVAVLEDGGLYKMWYSGGPSSGSWQTGYATSSDGLDWEIYAGNPVLEAGAPGSWDEMESDGPTVIKDGETYKMWYHGCNADYSVCSIGYATSDDGINWSKHGDPVLEATSGQWDESGLGWPRVIKNGATYEMWYHSDSKIGYATSSDGVAWTKYAGNPVLSEGWDGGGVGVSSLLLDGGTYKMWTNSGAGATLGIGYLESANGITWTQPVSNPVMVSGEPGVIIDVTHDYDQVRAVTLADTAVTITVSDSEGVKATISGVTDQWGSYRSWEHNEDWSPGEPDILAGDTVGATANGYSTTVETVGEIEAQAFNDTDVVTGTIHAPWFAPDSLSVLCELYTDPSQAYLDRDVPADGGNFQCDFSGLADITSTVSGKAGYLEPDGDMVSVPIKPQYTDLVVNVNYGHDWVEGNYDPGYTVWLTVTESDGGTVKATVELETQVIPWWWGGQTGFSTSLEGVAWNPSQPDIQEGDWVYGLVDREPGYASRTRVGIISGTLDLDADTISGTISAPGFSETLNGSCGVWEENGPGEGFQVDPDGGSYSCDFGALGWDLQPGDDVGVQYNEPDGDNVINVFRSPAPNLRLEKWAEGSGQVAPDGPVVFTLRYFNEGDAPATTIYLTDTLPTGTAYDSDTSGVTPDSGTGWVAWTLDEPLDPGYQRQFQLVLTHSAVPDETLHNVADISTLYDFDTGNNHAEADAQVQEGQPDLYVNKNPNPGDPAAGQTMLWEIDYGNNGPVGSGAVVLTDTLPEGTSIVGWDSENGYDGLWTDQSTADQLILQAPTLPGQWGDRILLRLQLDPALEVGTRLTNTVEISTANDAQPDDNWHQRDDVKVNWPRWNGHVNKEFDWGSLVPGGEAGYSLNVRNNGNMATSVVITDTLPAGTTFVEAWQSTGSVEVPFPPDFIGGGLVVWDLGLMEPGQWHNLNFRVALDGGLEPGTVLTNCVDLAIDGDEEWPYDNSDCVAETIREAGPNLRVLKEHRWNWEGQIEYTVKFLNVGTTTLHDVVLTDTMPEGTSFNGNWWNWFWEGMDFSPVGDQLVWTLSRLEPGWSSGLLFQVDLDDELVGEEGLAFVNLVEAPITGDVYPADNSYQVTAYTGPDVYVKKWLKAGELRAGEIVTFTVEFGNQNVWPWDGDPSYGSHITDTLPAAMTFITSTAPWDPNEPWQPEQIVGNSVVWEWGTMGSDSWWRFDLVAEVGDTVEPGQMLINEVAAYGDSPDDIEPNYDNNVFELPLLIEGRRIYVPLVVRNYQP